MLRVISLSVVSSALVAAAIAVGVAGALAPQRQSASRTPLTPSFVYQGRVVLSGIPADGLYDFEFRLFDTESGGTQLAAVTANDVPVSNGLFSVQLGFGNHFQGDERYLEVLVSPDAPGIPLTNLGRQRLAPTPYAIYSAQTDWNGILNMPATFLDGVDNDTLYTAGPGLTLSPANQLSVTFAGTGTASTAARSDHDHFGDQWTGASADSALYVYNYDSAGSGIVGGTGSSVGYLGYNQRIGVLGSLVGSCGAIGFSDAGAGVYGSYCGSSSATGDGVKGYSIRGAGVHGQSITGSGNATIGVLGVANAEPSVRPSNTGVYGYANAANATGVYGRADGDAAVGVKGIAPSDNQYAGLFQGKVLINGNLVNPSDRSLKHDIASLGYGLDEVLDLQPVSYVMNDDASSRVRFGLIAQDVETVIPELVEEMPGQATLSLNYLDLLPILINAIQEQQAEIDALRSTASALPDNSPGSNDWQTPLSLATSATALVAVLVLALRLRRQQSIHHAAA